MTKISQNILINGAAKDVFDAISTEQGVKSWWTNFTKVDDFEGGRAEFHFPAYNVSKYAEVKTVKPAQQVKTHIQPLHRPARLSWASAHILPAQ